MDILSNKLDFFGAQRILLGFDEKQLEFFSEMVQKIEVGPDVSIIREGELSSDIYFVISGTLEVTKKSSSGEVFVIGEIKEGSVFGEIAYIDSKPRSSSIRTKTKAIIYQLPIADLKDRAKINPEYSDSFVSKTLDLLYKNIARATVSRIRLTNSKFVESIKEKIQQVELQNDFGSFFVFMIMFFSAYNLLFRMLLSERITPLMLFTTSIILLGTNILFVVKRNIPLKNVGLTWKNSGSSLLKTTVVLLLSLFTIGALVSFINQSSWEVFFKHIYAFTPSVLYGITLGNLFYAFTLEFITRGVMLSTLKRFLNDQEGYKSILMIAVLFIPFNIHQGVNVFIIKFYIDMLLGFLYVRQNSLVGVTLLHFLIIQILGIY